MVNSYINVNTNVNQYVLKYMTDSYNLSTIKKVHMRVTETKKGIFSVTMPLMCQRVYYEKTYFDESRLKYESKHTKM